LTFPVYKIEVYSPAAVLRYTITKEVIDVYSTTSLTDRIGTFSFSVPSEAPDGTSKYGNITVFDTIKIYYGYDSVGATPDFIGKVYQIQATKNDSGTFRTIKGRDDGEVTTRRFKGMKDWVAVGASTITTELADDLGLGTGDIVVDASAETHRIDIDKHETYFGFLKKVSDYWVNAGTQVKKDFYVDVDGDLVWKARPIRTANVESFTVGSDIYSYSVLTDLTATKNRIWVYGSKGRPEDSTLDAPTEMADPEDTTNVDVNSASGQKVLSVAATASFSPGDKVFIYWGTTRYEQNVVDTINAGVSLTMVTNLANNYVIGDYCVHYPGWLELESNVTITADAVTYKVGARSVSLAAAAAASCRAGYMPDSNYNLNYYPRINFFLRSDTTDPVYVSVWDSSGNSAFYELGTLEADSKFHFYQISTGRDNTGGWELSGVVDWADIMFIEIGQYDVNSTLLIDGLYIDNRRYRPNANGYIEDATSQTSYGIREMVVVDDDLPSDSACEIRGEALLYQLKDPITRIDLEVDGNTNVLIGDRLSLTIPAEDISAVNYDVVSVMHRINTAMGFKTFINCVDSANNRSMPARTKDEFLIGQLRTQQDVGRGLNVLK